MNIFRRLKIFFIFFNYYYYYYFIGGGGGVSLFEGTRKFLFDILKYEIKLGTGVQKFDNKSILGCKCVQLSIEY